jgi:phage-related protein
LDQVRDLVIFKDYFYRFFNKQSKEAKEKIDFVLFLITHVDQIPKKFLKHITGQKGLYEIRVQHGTNIFRIFCCFDEGKIIVLFNGFQKKSQKTNATEIKLAVKLMSDYFESKLK